MPKQKQNNTEQFYLQYTSIQSNQNTKLQWKQFPILFEQIFLNDLFKNTNDDLFKSDQQPKVYGELIYDSNAKCIRYFSAQKNSELSFFIFIKEYNCFELLFGRHFIDINKKFVILIRFQNYELLLSDCVILELSDKDSQIKSQEKLTYEDELNEMSKNYLRKRNKLIKTLRNLQQSEEHETRYLFPCYQEGLQKYISNNYKLSQTSNKKIKLTKIIENESGDSQQQIQKEKENQNLQDQKSKQNNFVAEEINFTRKKIKNQIQETGEQNEQIIKYKSHVYQKKYQGKLSRLKKLTEDNIQIQMCSICYQENIRQYACLNCCSHRFCISCLSHWSENKNYCPLCKKSYRFYKVYDGGLFIRREQIKKKKDIQEEEENGSEDEDEQFNNADSFCYKCKQMGNHQLLLVCEYCKVKCCHTYCLVPPLEEVPENVWYCDFCIQRYNLLTGNPIAHIFDSQQIPNGMIIEENKEDQIMNENGLQNGWKEKNL